VNFQDEDRCRPIYYASKNTQAIKSICGDSTDQSTTVSHSHVDYFDNEGHISTTVRLPYGKDNIMETETKGTLTNPRKLNKRATRSYGRMKICRKKGPSAASSSLLEQWRSPTKITSRQYKRTDNHSKDLKELNTKLKNHVTNNVEPDKVEIRISSLPSSSMKELLSDITSNSATDELDFMTPQPIVKSICIMDSHESIKSALNKKRRILDPPRTLILDDEDMGAGTANVDINKKIMSLLPISSQSRTSIVKYCEKEYEHSEIPRRTRVYQPSSHTSLSDAKAFFAQLDATEELTINATKDKNHYLCKRSENNQCVRTVQKRNMSDPSLLKSYASYRRASKENGLSPLTLQMFAICQRDHFYKSGICNSLLEEN